MRRAGYTQSWSVTLERQVMRETAIAISYVVNHSIHLMDRYQANPGLIGPGATTGNVNSRRLHPGFGNLTFASSFGWSHYNALQAQITKRTSHGLTLLANYTWGKAMGIDSSPARSPPRSPPGPAIP